MTLRLAAFLLLLGIPAAAQDTLVSIRNLGPRQLRAAYFVLDAPQDIRIDATGGAPQGRSALRRFLEHGVFQGREDKLWDPQVWAGNAWILDARTREMLWELRTAATRSEGNGLQHFDGSLHLAAGAYEVRYAALFPVSRDWSDRRDWRVRYEGEAGELHGPYLDDESYLRFHLTVRGRGHRASATEVDDVASGTAVVTLRGTAADTRERIGFVLDRPLTLDLYLVGEKDGHAWNDYGWIMNADTRETVWNAGDEAAEPAGGAAKNRSVRRRIALPAGRYVAFHRTDHSHHGGAWNEAPPYDPSHWGLTLRVADPGERAAAQAFEYLPVPAATALVALTGLKDDELRWQRFALPQPTDLRIFAVGEMTGGHPHDYGWIVDGAGRPVWRMADGTTKPAGGAPKNRLFDGTVRLPAGTYVAYFVTDGSHSAGDGWNAEPPVDEAYWGLTVAPVSGTPNPGATRLTEDAEDPSVLARLVRVGDDRKERAAFELQRQMPVRIYAVGEGNGEMFDYGWIEDAAGHA
ncbi:MAG: hypothetical protein HY560_00965, partial [Gemmatimonadetes bacterium]|nr:hypothetical protein [Gemmatimonadota bacterium]